MIREAEIVGAMVDTADRDILGSRILDVMKVCRQAVVDVSEQVIDEYDNLPPGHCKIRKIKQTLDVL